MPTDPTLFDLQDSVLRIQDYQDLARPLVQRFLRECQQRLDSAVNQPWTDLRASSDRLSVALSLSMYAGWQKIVFEQTDNIHSLPHQAPELYCPDWPRGVRVFTANCAADHRCPNATELGSASHFQHQLNDQLK